MEEFPIPALRSDAMSVDDAIASFAEADYDLPTVPLVWCLVNWGLAAPRILDLIERYADGSDRSESTTRAALYCMFLAAGAREKRAFAPLCRLARDADAMDECLGDSVTESFHNILVSTFDGDIDALKSLIEDGTLDEFIRTGVFQALAFLTASGQIDRQETATYLAGLSETLKVVPGDFGWDGWAMAIVSLGLAELMPLVKAACDDGRITPDIGDVGTYQKKLKTVAGYANPLDFFKEQRVHIIEDVVSEFDGWYCFSEERRRDEAATSATKEDWDSRPFSFASSSTYDTFDAQIPVINPYRDVGRNDPCPCGSGRKFKKCCLK